MIESLNEPSLQVSQDKTIQGHFHDDLMNCKVKFTPQVFFFSASQDQLGDPWHAKVKQPMQLSKLQHIQLLQEAGQLSRIWHIRHGQCACRRARTSCLEDIGTFAEVHF